MTHKNVFMALAAAQAEMGSAKKSANNPHFKSKYADLAEIVDVAKPVLTKHGLCYYHVLETAGNARYMVTVLAHGESETEIRCPVELLISKPDMQSYKSATTYAKRIGLESVTGIAPEDDDGNAAAKAPQKAPTVSLPVDIEPSLPAFIAYCRDQHGGGDGFAEYVADTFLKLWEKKPTKVQVLNAWDKNQDALDWLETTDKKQYGRVVDGFENRVMALDSNFERAAE